MIFKTQNKDIPFDARVKIKKMNHIVEVTYIEKKSQSLKKFKKIDKNTMLNLETGELIQVDNKEDRQSNLSSLRRTISSIRDLINMNFTGQKNELFITLTYKENMQDLDKLYKDFEKFYKKLKRRFKNQELLYISVVEPQERGAWHIHLLLKNLSVEELYIPNETISNLWGNGFTKTERLAQVDNIGAYLSSYLTNLREGEETKKGQRLHLYPSGMNIYRCSKNVKRPIVVDNQYKYIESIKDFKTYEVSYLIADIENMKELNYLKKEYYNLKRV